MNAVVRAFDAVLRALVMSLVPCLVSFSELLALFALAETLSTSWSELEIKDCAVSVSPAKVLSMDAASPNCIAISPTFALNVVSSFDAFSLPSSSDRSLATLSATVAMVCAKVWLTCAAT